MNEIARYIVCRPCKFRGRFRFRITWGGDRSEGRNKMELL
jgi:hypothetical protein